MSLEPWEQEAETIRTERERAEREALAAEAEASQALQQLREAAAGNARRVRAAADKREADEFTSLLDGIVKRAEAATGLTREQMLAMPDAPVAAEPPNERQLAANRGVPEKHLRSVVDKAPTECDALQLVRAFLASDRTFLVLSSTVGRMKSGSACWALTQRSGLYLKAAELSNLPFSRDEEAVTTWRSAKRVGLLVLDDLSADYFDDKGYFYRALNTLIDSRYENMLKTVITTNMEPGDFKRHVKERIADRIREDGDEGFVSLGGESVRKHWSEPCDE